MGIKVLGTMQCPASGQRTRLLREVGQELVSDLSLFLKEVKEFGYMEGGRRVFQRPEKPVQGLEAAMTMSAVPDR